MPRPLILIACSWNCSRRPPFPRDHNSAALLLQCRLNRGDVLGVVTSAGGRAGGAEGSSSAGATTGGGGSSSSSSGGGVDGWWRRRVKELPNGCDLHVATSHKLSPNALAHGRRQNGDCFWWTVLGQDGHIGRLECSEESCCHLCCSSPIRIRESGETRDALEEPPPNLACACLIRRTSHAIGECTTSSLANGEDGYDEGKRDCYYYYCHDCNQ